jgi:DNA-binding SARP family transcriptional activator
VAKITSDRSQALLAYLVLHCQAAQSRQRIAFHLWSESPEERARANLRKELSHLRHALPNPDEYLRVDTKTLQWLPQGNFTLDVAEFEAAVKAAEQATDPSAIQAKLEQAIELYRGDLLPDWDDEWVLLERERLQQLHLRVLERLVKALEAQHDYQTALTYARQMLRIDSLNEATYSALMRLYSLSGDRAKALQVYHQCMTVLREELGIDPSLTTRKLYEQLLRADEPLDCRSHGNSSSGSPFLPRPSVLPSGSDLALSPLVGRNREWASIQQWASAILLGGKSANHRDAAIGDISKALLLVGEPGIGKTRLLEELQALAQTDRARVLWGRGFAAEMMRPYGIWIDALRSAEIASTVNVPSELGFLLPELGQASPVPPDLAHLFDAVVQLLMQWAKQAPLLILLDDLQWIDEASSALLHYAIRLLRPLPVLFAFAARTQELGDNAAISRLMQALRREQRLQTLELLPFDRQQTAELIRSVRAKVPSELSLAVVDRVFIDSGGNPLFVLEIARALGQNQPTQAIAVEALIRDRLHQLDDATREILPWAAALGRSFNPSTVARVADYPATKLLTALEDLEQQAIIRPSTSVENEIGYDFAHDIVRQVVYQQLSAPRRQSIHRQIAHKLHQQELADNALASTIVHHAALGGDRALAASAALAAAERCLKLFAYKEAVELAQQGIEHCQFLEPPTRILLHAKLLLVCALAGVTGDRAARLEIQVQQLIHAAKSQRLNEAEAIALETLATLQFERCNYTEVHQHSLRVAEVSRVASSATAAARMLAFSGSCLAEIGRDMLRAEALLRSAQPLAARVGLELCDLFGGLGCIDRHYGRYDEAKFQLQQAWRLAQAQQDRWRECNYLGYLAMVELESGDPVAALPYCDEMSAIAAKIQGEGSEAAVAAALEALTRYQMGQPNAGTALERAIATLEQLDAKRMLAYVSIGAAEVDLNCDRPDLAVNRAEAALKNAQIVNQPSEIALSWAILIQGLLALGEREQATTQFELLQQTVERCDDLSLLARVAVEHSQSAVANKLCNSPSGS